MAPLSEKEKEQIEKLTRIELGIEKVVEHQTEALQSIKKIETAVFDPENGLYSRLKSLETWKRLSSKLMWLFLASLITLTFSSFSKHLFK